MKGEIELRAMVIHAVKGMGPEVVAEVIEELQEA
jgi:hypothetical protein